MACLLLFGGSNALSVSTPWYGQTWGWAAWPVGPLGVLAKLHPQGAG